MTCQSIGFSNRTEVIDQLVCTDSGVILCRYTAYCKQYTGKNKDQFVLFNILYRSVFLLLFYFSPDRQDKTTGFTITVYGNSLDKRTGAVFRIISDFDITSFTRSYRFFCPFRCRTATRGDHTCQDQRCFACILYFKSVRHIAVRFLDRSEIERGFICRDYSFVLS